MTRILIIEDVEEIGENLKAFAHHAGFSSHYASNFSELSLEQLSSASHIILDLNMPGHDGLDVLEELSKKHITAPVILCSGVAENIITSAIDVLHELGLVFGGRLPKPFSFEKFREVVTDASNQNVKELHSKIEARPLSLTKGDLSVAIKRGWFYPVFQPQIDIHDNSMMGVECLARLSHPLFGECKPDVFIPKLVETGQIDEFTDYFIRNVMSSLARIGFPETMRVSFNIDPNSLYKQFLTGLATFIEGHYIKPEQVCFEITELSEVELSKELKSALTKLRVHGIHLSMDDFGTGFSTIHELDQLPFDELKVDRSFVSHMENRVGSLAIIKNIIALGRDLNMVVVAEGVETQEQAESLQALGCHIMQGFYFSKPLDIGALEKAISTYV